MARILIAGESWTTTSIHVKGFDSFTTVAYEEGAGPLRDVLLVAGHEVTFLPNHLAATDFPFSSRGLEAWDVVLLSDIGSNTLLVPPATFTRFEARPNRLAALRDWTRSGGGLAMVGGYLSFQGIEGKANYRGTPLAEVLPVEIEPGDDRVEAPEDPIPRLTDCLHPITAGLPREWPSILGYQRLAPKSGCSVLARVDGHPLVVAGEPGDGRALAYASDIGPHWAPPAFVEWDGYARFWDQAARWLAG
ncbi:MAG: glutamine amidotransferase [Gaiellaceae bacterium]